MAGVIALSVAVGLVVLAAALWPAARAPQAWRRWTRPLRRRLHPRRYGRYH